MSFSPPSFLLFLSSLSSHLSSPLLSFPPPPLLPLLLSLTSPGVLLQILKRGCHVNDRDGLTDMTLLHYSCKAGAHGVGMDLSLSPTSLFLCQPPSPAHSLFLYLSFWHSLLPLALLLGLPL